MKRLSKYEKETIINFDEGGKEAFIYTFNADLKRRLADFSQKYPALCRLERSTAEGSVTYVLDKSRLSVRLVPPYSEERRAAAREYAKQHGFQIVKPERDSACLRGGLRSKHQVQSRGFDRELLQRCKIPGKQRTKNCRVWSRFSSPAGKGDSWQILMAISV